MTVLTDVLILERLSHLAVEAGFLRHFEAWHTRDLRAHIKALYEQARQDGFPGWKDP